MSDFDCKKCGACCLVDPTRTVDGMTDEYAYLSGYDLRHRIRPAGLTDLVHIIPKSKRPGIVKGLGGEHGSMKTKSFGDFGMGCIALKGRPGGDCRCGIYEHRPTACRKFEPGSEECHVARAELGLSSVYSA